ncbi:zinc finger protein 2 homolog [Hyposmocoma kahamanoa]|uniref:zinc finger protein 2 homolog n=1 Tax=Hyposmocoma kahamanoa TaxID=1477025 RepID=UPI000E6D8578|nr:zinc finger protein 2 homolog [Hyposmocoma kahamanoa]
MMFDPPDFPYKELCDTLRDQYDTDDLLLTHDTTHGDLVSSNKSLAEVTEQMITSVENQLSFHSNDNGRFFNVENNSFLDTNSSTQNTELYIVQPSDNLFNYEPNLLDENTVNQFLLPLQNSSENNKDAESTGPDLLALHSCVICHDIFTTDSDLLDHTISVHASDTPIDQRQNNLPDPSRPEPLPIEESSNGSIDFEAEWLVCSVCSRVLSTALEIEPSEQLCCNPGADKPSVSSRKLHTMYVCDFCSGLFADGEALDRHRLTCFIQDQPTYFPDQLNTANVPSTQSPEVLFSCDSCGKQYVSTEELKIHTIECQRPVPVSRRSDRRAYTTANSNKMWNCGSCNQLFATARELYRHKRGEDRPPGAPLMAYVCEECDKVLGSMCALHTHKKMHKVSKPGYPCRVCGRRFNQSGHLAIHMRMHTGERPYPCDLCPKAFKVKVERDDHRRTHTGERPFACSACPKTFTAAARLREHARIHTDQRPYRCDICGAAFRRPYARTVHTLIHTGEKPHECDICGTAFRRSGDMWKHKRTLHGIQATAPEV